MPETRRDIDPRLDRLVDEQDALRRVAALVAGGVSSAEIFAAVGDEVGRLFDAEVTVARFEADGSVEIVGQTPGIPVVSVGTGWELDVLLATTTAYGTERPRTLRSSVVAPIVVDADPWGVIALSHAREALPADTVERVERFTALVATAIANAQSRTELTQLAAEQASLRRVATLVAHRARPEEVFSAVSNAVAQLLASDQVTIARYEPDGSAAVIVGASDGIQVVSIGSRWELEEFTGATAVYRTGRPARRDRKSFESASGPLAERIRATGLVSSVGAPIVVEGNLWGVITVVDRHKELPADAEEWLENFTELVAAAIANTQSRAELAASEARARKLAGEQAALRKVATLVAQGASTEELFAAVAHEVAAVIDVPVVGMHRYESDGTFTTVGISGETNFKVGSRWPVEEESVAGMILETLQPVRKEDYTGMTGPLGVAMRDDEVVSTVGVPIVVDGDIWGFVVAGGRRGSPIPAGTEEALARFTELVATAIANSQARAHIARLADEQAALRRVATLVARGARSEEVFSAVSDEVAQLFGAAQAGVARYEPDGSGLVMVGVSKDVGVVSIGQRWELEASLGLDAVYETGRPARSPDGAFENPSGPIAASLGDVGIVSAVGSPIIVEGNPWGFVAYAADEPPPADAEQRLENFTELVATAVANAQSRAELAASEAHALELAREQTSLRRVATLIAQTAPAEDVFTAVAEEVASVLDAPQVTICRFEAEEMLVLSAVGAPEFTAGSRWPFNIPSLPATVHKTGSAVRIDDFTNADGLDAFARDESGVKSAVGAPIVVDGVVWGSINAASTAEDPFPADAEERLSRFTDLVATSVSNATMRREIAASRARVIAAADESRRQIERDLHDGAQQQLVTLAVALHRATAKIPGEMDEVRAEVGRVAEGLTDALQELREISRGIHPAVLTEGGLSPALKALGRRSNVAVKLDLGSERRLPVQIEAAAYYIVAEALTNASRHAGATCAWVSLHEQDDTLNLSVRDDGAGGADPSRGSGLIGLRDRVDALGGTIEIDSPPLGGTRIDVGLPLPTG